METIGIGRYRLLVKKKEKKGNIGASLVVSSDATMQHFCANTDIWLLRMTSTDTDRYR